MSGESQRQHEISLDESTSIRDVKPCVSTDNLEPVADGKDVEAGKENDDTKTGGRAPAAHPMHPSQFIGDQYARPAMVTLLGCFCVMVRIACLWIEYRHLR